MQNLQAFFRLAIKDKKRIVSLFWVFLLLMPLNIYAQADEKESLVETKPVENEGVTDAGKATSVEPITVNGDKVEFFTEKKEVVAIGNVEVIYKGTKLTCEKLTVNSLTKEGVAEGNARLEDKDGVIVGSKITYNFVTKTGTIIDSGFRANPYFGRAEISEKVSEDEFVNRRGYFTTCGFENPHYRIKSRKMTIFPGDKIQTKEDTFYAGRVPLLYLPQYNRSLRDPIMHVQFMPGKSKQWGPFLLSAWRYNLTEDVTGRIYLDWREKLGVAEGFGLNYTTVGLGKGDFKYYYARERNHTKDFPPEDVTLTRKFQRYLVRWRHKWDIDTQTNLVSEYYKIVDSKRTLYPAGGPGSSKAYNFLREYFIREYQQDVEPRTYVSIHKSFDYGGIDFIMQKRVNRWYAETEKLPEIRYGLPSYNFGDTPLYIEHTSQAAHFNVKNPVPSPSSLDKHLDRFDTLNKLAMPLKVSFVKLNPFIQHRFTYYDRDVYGAASVLRTVFYTGTDASTKFYRIFNVKSNFLRLDINSLRHIITPTVGYSYNNKPTIPPAKLVQIDSIDSISGRSNGATLQLSNILQTKRDGQAVEIANFLVTNSYSFKTRGSRGASFGDFLAKLELLPYAWVRFIANASYDRRREHFSSVTYDVNFDLWKESTFGFSERYQRKGPREFIYNLKCRLSPKWKFSVYHRVVTGHKDRSFKRGLREQEYVLSRDLHCWTSEITYNVTREQGETIWLIFRLKAFPELNFEYNQQYHMPKPGELSY